MLRYVVERPDGARALQAARLALQESPVVAELKAVITGESSPRWTSDYSGALWALRLLAEWGHPGDDETIATALDWALTHTSETSHPHATPLLLHTALAFGFSDDDRVESLLQQVFILLQTERRTRLGAVGATLTAMALATLQDRAIPTAVLAGLESLLSPITPTAHPLFTAYGYPTYDTPDGLTLVESALRLGLRGTWLDAWVAQIVAAQDEAGFWRAGRVHLPDITPNEPNRRLSAKALYVLRSYYGE